MVKAFEWMIAMRYLRTKRKEGFISVVSGFSLVGIALGVATLIIVMAVMNGYRVQLIERILGINGHITITTEAGNVKNYEAFINEIENIKGVDYVAPLISGQALAATKDASSGVMVRGMNADDIIGKPLMAQAVNDNSLQLYANGEGILLGDALARKLRVGIGSKIKLISPEVSTTVVGMIPRMKSYTVVGTFDIGMYEYNLTTVFMPLEDAQRFFKFKDSVSDIEVMVMKPDNIGIVKSKIADIAPESIRMTDWGMANQTLINVLNVERNVMFLILTLIIIVAAFNIISSLIMLVKDKGTNIAVLRTIGASKNSIVKIFVISGSMVGIIGTAIGCVLGVSFALNIETIRKGLESITGVTLFDPVVYFLTTLPAELEISSVVMVVMMALLLSLLATIYPAWRASKLMPAEALRYE